MCNELLKEEMRQLNSISSRQSREYFDWNKYVFRFKIFIERNIKIGLKWVFSNISDNFSSFLNRVLKKSEISNIKSENINF
jgi:hypothetical protein